MKRILFAPFAGLGLLSSCNQPPATEIPEVAVASEQKAQPPIPPPPRAEAAPKKEALAPVAKKEEAPVPPPMFPFPNDVSGKALPAVVAPPAPAPPAIEKFGKTPAVRAASSKVAEPNPLTKMLYAPPPLLPGRPAGLSPTDPAERIPLDLGIGAEAVPARPAFPETPGIALVARDVKLPPDLVPLGKQLPDRASLDDPTAESGNAAIVNRTPRPALGQAGFLKMSLPDPFEFGEQVKPRVMPAAEPSPMPIPVNPQRIK